MPALRTVDGTPLAADVRDLVVAGWAGRDQAAVLRHIAELEAIGVAPPSEIPLFYRVSADRLSTAGRVQVLGGDSAGEVEAVLLGIGGRLWVGVGSDHTERKVESFSMAVAKEMCPKPMAPVVWPFDEVAGHWDRLLLRARAVIDGANVLYQEGAVAALLSPLDLVARWTARGGVFGDGRAMFCGTLPAIGGVRPASRFEMTLEDPVLGRALTHAYDIECLPVAV